MIVTIPGTPPLWRRARVAVQRGRSATISRSGKVTPARRGRVLHFTDDDTRDDEARVAAAARGIRMPDGPIRLHIVAIWPRPKSRPREVSPQTWQAKRPRHVAPDVWATWRPLGVPPSVWALGCAVRKHTVPDWDNVGKAVSDGLTKAGVWADDARVAVAEVETWYAGVNNGACTVVTVEPVGWV